MGDGWVGGWKGDVVDGARGRWMGREREKEREREDRAEGEERERLSKISRT